MNITKEVIDYVHRIADQFPGLNADPNHPGCRDQVDAFIRTDGSQGTAGQTERLGDVNFPTNSFYTQFPDTLPISAEAQGLPNMQGSGLVRSLREAASGNADLATALTSFASHTGADAKQGNVTYRWLTRRHRNHDHLMQRAA